MNVKAILEKYGVNVVTERSNDYDCCCPLHNDRAPSFSINKNDGLWLCRSGCGSGNIVSLISRIEKCSIDEAKEKLREYVSINTEIHDRIEKLKDTFVNGVNKKVRVYTKLEYPESFKFFSSINHNTIYDNYMASRVPLRVAEAMRLGYCSSGYYAGRVILTVHMNGELIGFTGRSVYPNAEKRYLIPHGVSLGSCIWGYDQPLPEDKSAWLCESIFDALTLIGWGYAPVFATFGANISDDQIALLIKKGVTRITLCFHNDNAGLRAVEKKAQSLLSVFSVSRLILPPDKDVNEMPQFEFNTLQIEPLQDDSQRVNKIRHMLSKKRII
jgi:DNA primase